MTVGTRIQSARKEKKLSQQELGELLGVSGSMIGQYENNLRNPKLGTLRKIAVALDVTVDYLTGFTSEPHTRNANQADIDKMYGDPLFPMELAESEKDMLENYRMLTVEGRNAVDELVNYFLGLELKTKK